MKNFYEKMKGFITDGDMVSLKKYCWSGKHKNDNELIDDIRQELEEHIIKIATAPLHKEQRLDNVRYSGALNGPAEFMLPKLEQLTGKMFPDRKYDIYVKYEGGSVLSCDIGDPYLGPFYGYYVKRTQ